MCHWIITDISVQELTSYSIETIEIMLGTQVDRAINSTELISYLPPSPPPKTGYHRYVFVLLASEIEENSTVDQSNITKPVDRPHWGYGKVGKGVRTWAVENELTIVGKLLVSSAKLCCKELSTGTEQENMKRLMNNNLGANFFYSENEEQ